MRQLRRLKNLTTYDLVAQDGEVGKLEEIYFEDEGWQIRYLVVRTGNWLLGREVLIPPAVVNNISDQKQQIAVALSRRQIEESPPPDTKKTVSRHYEEQFFQHYNLEPYWHLDPLPSLSPPIPPTEVNAPLRKPENPHLRSSSEVHNYRIHATDSEMGHVESFIIDDQDWSVRYLEIETGQWFHGKKVLVSPAWIQEIDWSKEKVFIDLPGERIKSAPEYDPKKVISRDYEIELYTHYGKAQRWG